MYGVRTVGKVKDNDIEDLDLNVIRYKPVSIDELCKRTKFSRKELQIMYRGFKQECPTGIVNEESFKQIYSQFFPLGDASMYAHHVFSTFDRERTEALTFEQFVESLSKLCRANKKEKLRWAFGLYDINRDGVISKGEMISVVTSIYDLLGRHTNPIVEEKTPKEHVDKVFKKMDLNGDGFIDWNEFYAYCEQNPCIMNSLDVFNTVLCFEEA